MATLHGKDALIYLEDSSNTIQELPEANEFSFDLDADLDPDPAFGDDWETKLLGLRRASGAIAGNFDDADAADLFDACTHTASRTLYIYPACSVATRFYYGDVWCNLSVSGGTSGRITFSIAWQSDDNFYKIPA